MKPHWLGFVCLLLVLTLGAGCDFQKKRDPSILLPCDDPMLFCIDYTGCMKDRSILTSRIHLLFDSDAGLREARVRKQRLKQGLDLVLKDYWAERLIDDKGQRLVRICRRLCNELLKNKVVEISVSGYKVTPKCEKNKAG